MLCTYNASCNINTRRDRGCEISKRTTGTARECATYKSYLYTVKLLQNLFMLPATVVIHESTTTVTAKLGTRMASPIEG